jgi:hypothetical protein
MNNSNGTNDIASFFMCKFTEKCRREKSIMSIERMKGQRRIGAAFVWQESYNLLIIAHLHPIVPLVVPSHRRTDLKCLDKHETM